MRTQTIRTVTGTVIHSCLWALILFAPAAAAAANDKATAGDSGAVLDFHATVSAVREVPAGNPMPGLHLQAKVKGRMMDIYIAPLDFVAQCGVKVSRGDEVHIVGSQTKSDVVLAHEITIGSYTNGTFYLRGDDGPFWEDTKPAQPIAVH